MRALCCLTVLVFTGLVSISRLSAQTTSEQIKAIKTEFKAINYDTTLKKVTLENEEFLGDNIGDGGGELVNLKKEKNRHDDEETNPTAFIQQANEILYHLTRKYNAS